MNLGLGDFINPLLLPAPEIPVEVFECSDDKVLQGRAFRLRMQAQDDPTAHRSFELASEMIATYIEGKDGQQPLTFPGIGGERLKLSKILFRRAAMVHGMQAPESEQQRLSFEQIVHLAYKLPLTWEKLAAFCDELNTRFTNDLRGKSEDVTE